MATLEAATRSNTRGLTRQSAITVYVNDRFRDRRASLLSVL